MRTVSPKKPRPNVKTRPRTPTRQLSSGSGQEQHRFDRGVAVAMPERDGCTMQTTSTNKAHQSTKAQSIFSKTQGKCTGLHDHNFDCDTGTGLHCAEVASGRAAHYARCVNGTVAMKGSELDRFDKMYGEGSERNDSTLQTANAKKARPGTPSRHSGSWSGQVQHRFDSRTAPDGMLELEGRRHVKMSERNAKVFRPQESATSSASRASSATPVGRHGTPLGGAARVKKDSEEHRCPRRRMTESMVDSMYALSSQSEQAVATKVPFKTLLPFHRSDRDSLDLPPIGSSPTQKIKHGMTHRLDEAVGLQQRDHRPRSSLY